MRKALGVFVRWKSGMFDLRPTKDVHEGYGGMRVELVHGVSGRNLDCESGEQAVEGDIQIHTSSLAG
jgi:hypothetical protein